MERLFFIVNPVAGSGHSMRGFEEIRSILDGKDVDYGYVMSTKPFESGELARAAIEAGEKCIIAVGGDGTVNEVASAVYTHDDVIFGFVPLGTGNDLARAVHMPTDVREAIEIILAGRTRKMDAGLANGRFFINVSGFGFDVDVLINTERYKKRFNGMLPYMLGIFRALTHLRTLHLTVRNRDEEPYEMDALLVSVGNGTHIGGGMKAVPLAEPFDGLLDVCLVEKVGVLKFLSLLPKFVKGKHIETAPVRYFRTDEIYFECPEDCLINYDGELDSHPPVHYKLLKSVLNLLVKDADE